MMHARIGLALARVASATLWGVREAGAQQSMDARMNTVRTGTVRFTMTAAEGVCGNGASWYRSRDGRPTSSYGMWNGSPVNRDVETTCDRGPVRVVVERDAGDSKNIRLYVGGRWRADTNITDLGAVSTRDAAGWLLNVAEQGPEKVARNALQAALLADSVNATPALLRMAHSESRSPDMRTSAVRYLAERAGERVSASLDSIAYEPGDREVRNAAIMAIAHRPKAEAVPALIKLAETLPDRELRRTAVRALAQTREPEAIAWIERNLGRN